MINKFSSKKVAPKKKVIKKEIPPKKEQRLSKPIQSLPIPKKRPIAASKVSSQKRKAIQDKRESKNPTSKFSLSLSKRREIVAMLEEVESQVTKNENLAIIHSTSSQDFTSFYYAIIKNSNLEVCKTNNNSVFQPHEKREKKDFAVLHIIQIGKTPATDEGLIKVLKQTGCPVHKVHSVESIRQLFNELD